LEKDNIEQLINGLVDDLKKAGAITTSGVEDAFRTVPRHLFVNDVAIEKIYLDEVIIIKSIDGVPVSSSSQPRVVAMWLEHLELEPGHKVLEIGAGTGYNAALMAHMVGKTGHVVTVDIDKDLCEMARMNLTNAGFDQVEVVCADGGYGHPSGGPYDRIILSVGASDIAPAWIEQLKLGGILEMGLEVNGLQRLVSFRRTDFGLASTNVAAVFYTRLQGDFADRPKNLMQIGSDPELILEYDNEPPQSSQAIYDLLLGEYKNLATGILVNFTDLVGGLGAWICTYEPAFCSLMASGKMVKRNVVPPLYRIDGVNKSVISRVLLSGEGLVGMMCPPENRSPLIGIFDRKTHDIRFQLFVRQYGQDGELASKVISLVKTWEQAGRPPANAMQISVYPNTADYTPQENELVVEKSWTNLVISWRNVD